MEDRDERQLGTWTRPGTVIGGRYVVRQSLASGGMGTVVEAVHQELRHPVAIKLLRGDALERDDLVERFLREARAAAGLTSEHAVRVLDLGRLPDGTPFTVMELLRGADLHQVRTRRAVSPEEAAEYVIQACAALAEAHARGIVHRDLKPSNLFLTEREDRSPLLKVLDFGISKVTGAVDGRSTAARAVLGSPLYMSPEQIRDARAVDARSDIWSLGVVLFELISGRPPFDQPQLPGLSAAIVSDEAPDLRELVPDVAPGLAAVVHRCLAKRPADRFQTAGSLAEALLPFAPARAGTAVERARRVSDAGPMSHQAFAGAPPPAVEDAATLTSGDAPSDGTLRSGTHSRARVPWLVWVTLGLSIAALGLTLLARRLRAADPSPAHPVASAGDWRPTAEGAEAPAAPRVEVVDRVAPLPPPGELSPEAGASAGTTAAAAAPHAAAGLAAPQDGAPPSAAPVAASGKIVPGSGAGAAASPTARSPAPAGSGPPPVDPLDLDVRQ